MRRNNKNKNKRTQTTCGPKSPVVIPISSFPYTPPSRIRTVPRPNNPNIITFHPPFHIFFHSTYNEQPQHWTRRTPITNRHFFHVHRTRRWTEESYWPDGHHVENRTDVDGHGLEHSTASAGALTIERILNETRWMLTDRRNLNIEDCRTPQTCRTHLWMETDSVDVDGHKIWWTNIGIVDTDLMDVDGHRLDYIINTNVEP